jgi:hypothetical protein
MATYSPPIFGVALGACCCRLHMTWTASKMYCIASHGQPQTCQCHALLVCGSYGARYGSTWDAHKCFHIYLTSPRTTEISFMASANMVVRPQWFWVTANMLLNPACCLCHEKEANVTNRLVADWGALSSVVHAQVSQSPIHLLAKMHLRFWAG